MKKFSFILFLVSTSLLTGCAAINDTHSQWRGDVENQNLLATMYANTLPICDGKQMSEHKACVSRIRKEYSARFSDRYKAYYTVKSAEELLLRAVVVSYLTEELSSPKVKSSSPANDGGRKLVCSAHSLSSQFAVSLSSFTVVPITCN